MMVMMTMSINSLKVQRPCGSDFVPGVTVHLVCMLGITDAGPSSYLRQYKEPEMAQIPDCWTLCPFQNQKDGLVQHEEV